MFLSDNCHVNNSGGDSTRIQHLIECPREYKHPILLSPAHTHRCTYVYFLRNYIGLHSFPVYLSTINCSHSFLILHLLGHQKNQLFSLELWSFCYESMVGIVTLQEEGVCVWFATDPCCVVYMFSHCLFWSPLGALASLNHEIGC